MTIAIPASTPNDRRSLNSRVVAFRWRMFSRGSRLAAVVGLGVLLDFSTLNIGAAVIASASVSDAVGDAVGGIADITSASVSIDDAGSITLTAYFASGTFSPSDDFVVFGLDLDRNSATSPTNIFLPGLGIEAYFNTPAGSNPGSGAVLLWNGVGYAVNFTTFPDAPLANGFTATVPLVLLGTTTPTMSFGVLTGTVVPEGEGVDASFRDWTSIGVVGQPATGVPDGGASALLLSSAFLGLLAGLHLLPCRKIAPHLQSLDSNLM